MNVVTFHVNIRITPIIHVTFWFHNIRKKPETQSWKFMCAYMCKQLNIKSVKGSSNRFMN